MDISKINVNEPIETAKNIKEGIYTNDDIGVMREHDFVNGYLDMFRELAKNPEDPKLLMSVPYRNWIKYTNGGKNKVNIVSDNNYEEVLFTVPQVIIESCIDYTWYQNTKNVLSSLPNAFTEQVNYIPERGERLFNSVVSKLATTVKDETSATDAIKEQWVSIFNRYSDNPTTNNETTTSKKDENLANETEELW